MSAPRAVIAAVAAELGEQIETNEAVAREWEGDAGRKAGAVSGIEERRKAAPGTCASDLACRASEKLFERTGADRSEVDTLLFCTQTPDYYLPTTACTLQDRLKLSRDCGALDFNQGSSGYVYGLWLAKALIESGQSRSLLLLTGDTYSRLIHPRDRSARFLFGDAGTATLIRRGEGDGGVGPVVLGTDGRGARQLIVPAGGFRTPRSPETAEETTDAEGNTRSADNLFMNGADVFRFAITQVPKAFQALLERSGLSRDDLDYIVLHQASAIVMDNLSKRLKTPAEKIPRRYSHCGNTVSSSIPVVLDAMSEEGLLRSGSTLALLGYGVGYSWGGCILRWE